MSGPEGTYCNQCGEQLPVDARTCSRCGAEQPPPPPEQRGGQQPRDERSRRGRDGPPRKREQRSGRRQPTQSRQCGGGSRRGRREQGPPPDDGRRHQRGSDGTSPVVIILAVLGVAFALLLVAPVLATFVLGLGDSVEGGPQTGPEVVTERFVQALADGDQQQAERYAHSDGPAATELDDIENHPNRPAAEDVTVTDWAILEESDDRMLLDVTLEYDSASAEPTTQYATVELRKENGEWRVWTTTVG